MHSYLHKIFILVKSGCYTFFVDTRRINIFETKISYSNVIPYACTDGEGKLVHI
jgi:hypothetical protein